MLSTFILDKVPKTSAIKSFFYHLIKIFLNLKKDVTWVMIESNSKKSMEKLMLILYKNREGYITRDNNDSLV